MEEAQSHMRASGLISPSASVSGQSGTDDEIGQTRVREKNLVVSDCF